MKIAGERGPLWRSRGEPQPVGPLELLFDLVFVYAISQLSQQLHDNVHWIGRSANGLVTEWAELIRSIRSQEL